MEIPENGFYYHYKHDDMKGENHHAYEVVGIGIHSENKNVLVIYRPLYEIDDLTQPISFLRPLDIFMEEVTANNLTQPRFTRITDPELMAKLEEVKKMMY